MRKRNRTKPQASGTGILKVKSSPSGAQIYINGKKSGFTPKRFSNLAPGIYKVKASLSGYMGYGEALSHAPNTTAANKQINRRVEVRLEQ